MIFNDNDTIVAPATPSGGALCLIRLSGEQSIAICDELFRGKSPLQQSLSHRAYYGTLVDGDCLIDDVVITVFKAPHTYTGEDIVEISAHGSRYIVQRIISAITQRGARLAEAGEFTRRAFLAGRLDLSQAEAVADIIAAESQTSHAIASTQMRGGYSSALQQLRNELITIGSLLELELDFSEEDVEFADRTKLRNLLEQITQQVDTLCESFTLGNAIKEGVIVAIVGEPNVGKSTLLNRLAGEQRAMVSDIAGTTRDTIESVVNIAGVRFRFIDTAGLHTTDDTLEQMGIERTREAISKAHIVLHMSDGTKSDNTAHSTDIEIDANQHLFHIINKIDLCNRPIATADEKTICLSAKSGEGIERLREVLASTIDSSAALRGDVVVSSHRHYQALCLAKESLHAAMNALERDLSADLLSEDIRQVMHHIGTITGDITTSDLLHSIFSKFCIGK